MPTDSGLTGLTFTRPSLVKPQFADECDLSKIVSRFIKSGELPNLCVRKPICVQSTLNLETDFETFQLKRVKVIQSFEQLPLEVREKFLHDPERWLDSLVNPADPAPADPAPADPAPANPAPSNA